MKFGTNYNTVCMKKFNTLQNSNLQQYNDHMRQSGKVPWASLSSGAIYTLTYISLCFVDIWTTQGSGLNIY